MFIASSEVQIENGEDRIKIRQFTKFEVLSLNCNHEEGFQKSEKKGNTLYGFRRCHLRIRDIFIRNLGDL